MTALIDHVSAVRTLTPDLERPVPADEMYYNERIGILDCEGVIGAGKTTLMTKLVAALATDTVRVFFVPEPVDEWKKSGMFAAFNADKQRMAYAFQVYVFSTRVGKFASVYRDALDHVNAAPQHRALLITERSPWGDRLFKRVMMEQGFFTKMEDCAYEQSFSAWLETVNKRRPDLVLWLNTSVDESLRRIKERARPDEAVDKDYQTRLYRMHAAALSGGVFEDAPVLEIDGGRNFRDDDAAVRQLATELKARLRGILYRN